MPWWAYLYLALFVLLTIAGVSDDLRRPHRALFISGEVFSAAFVVLFVAAYFYPVIASTLSHSIFVMVGLGMAYEIVAAHRVVREHELNRDSELSPGETAVLNNLGLFLGNLFVVPGYVFGLMAGLRNAGV